VGKRTGTSSSHIKKKTPNIGKNTNLVTTMVLGNLNPMERYFLPTQDPSTLDGGLVAIGSNQC
jgi:hypothetical protein